MSRDYKDTARPRQKGRTGPFLLGLMLGLLVGVLGSASVALYVSRMPNPFQARNNGNGAGANPVDAAEARPKGDQGKSPRFTFYDDLPKGNQSAPPAVPPAASAAPAAPPPAAAAPAAPAGAAVDDGSGPRPRIGTATSTENPAPSGTPAAGVAPAPAAAAAAPATWFLQAGAFQSQEDADNQKGRIALVGLDARIRSVDTPDKGKVFRVRLGPFNSQEEANGAAQTLKENGIATTMIKIPKPAPKPTPAAASNN